jgi:MSHA biogenesis protein MshQ
VGRVAVTYTIPPQLASDYRFDECTQYTGVAGEVLDSFGSSPGTPMGSLQNGTPGQIYRYADFSAAARYTEVPAGPMLNTSWTLSLWFKTPFATSATHSSQYYVLGSVSGGGDYIYLDRNASYRWGVYTTNASDSAGSGGSTNGTFQFSSLSSGWHHMVLVGSGNTTQLYIDGVYRDQVSRRVKGTFNYLGASYDSRGTSSGQSFGTPLDEFKVFSNPLDATQVAAIYANESAGKNWDGTTRSNLCPTIDHIELVHDGSALTCTPKAITVLACNSAASCYGVPASQYTAGTFSVSLAAVAGAQWCGDSLCATTLTSPATLSNGSVIYLKDTNVRTDRIGGTTSSASNAALQCFNTTNSGFNTTTACDIAFGASGFLVSLPHHVSCTNATLTVQAVQSNNNATNCVPMFRNRTRTETISFAYSSPATGTRVPTVAGTAISTAGTSVSLSFDNNGIATPTFVYQDAGRLTVTVTDPSLPMTGTTSTPPVIAPASFAFSGIPAAPLTAGQAFNATITAMNACSMPAATPNFSASTTLASSNPLPGMGNATAINTTVSSFTNGVASTNLTWNEVGTIDLTATSTNYLGSGLNVSGSKAAVGRFKPAYFDTFVTPGAGTFTYAGLVGPPVRAGQPFTVEVKAKRFGGDATDATNTANYAGATWAKAVTLSDAGGGSGTLANNSFAATDFASGKASRADVAYSFANKLTAPYTLTLRAIDTDAVSSSGHTEGSTAMRSGRLRLINYYGSELLAPRVEYRAEYWDGSRWATNTLDGTTAFLAANIAPGGLTVNTVGAINSGIGFITFNTATAGSYDIAVNLNTSGSDTSCNASHGGTAASKPWLQGSWGAPASCGGTAAWAQDPNARVRLGTSKTPLIYRRELY